MKTQIERYLAQVAEIDNSGFHAWVLENGKAFAPADVVEISPLVLAIFNPTPKACFNNSWRIANRIDELTYFEGFYLPGINGAPLFPMEHAFNVRESTGSVLDFTAQGGEIEVLEWFGLPLPLADVARALTEGFRTPLLEAFISQKGKKR